MHLQLFMLNLSRIDRSEIDNDTEKMESRLTYNLYSDGVP